jgi:hypothetical protein
MTLDIDALVRRLADDLRPVRRLWAPAWRAAGWLSAAFGLGLALALTGRYSPLAPPLQEDALIWSCFAAAAATSALAALAAFELSVPGTSRAWAAAPLPTLVLWLVLTELSCQPAAVEDAARWGTPGEALQCLAYIAAVSLPLGALATVLLRRACPLQPTLVMALVGLAAAGAASAVLCFVHPHHGTGLDLLAHLTAIGVLVAAHTLLGGRLFGDRVIRDRK